MNDAVEVSAALDCMVQMGMDRAPAPAKKPKDSMVGCMTAMGCMMQAIAHSPEAPASAEVAPMAERYWPAFMALAGGDVPPSLRPPNYC